MRTLEDIATDMAINAHDRTGDAETLHPRADDLLVETIQALTEHSHREARDMAERIIQSWKETPKWYA